MLLYNAGKGHLIPTNQNIVNPRKESPKENVVTTVAPRKRIKRQTIMGHKCVCVGGILLYSGLNLRINKLIKTNRN